MAPRSTTGGAAVRRALLTMLLAPGLLLAGLGAAPASAAPRALVVAKNGSDTAAGTLAHPMATVAAAVLRLGPGGGTVRLRGGSYHQRITLRGVRGVTVEPYAREHVVLSGVGLTAPAGMSAMVAIEDSSRVVLRGLDITGYRTTSTRAIPVGVLVTGHDRDVTIERNRVHHLGNDNGTLGSFAIDAHGIAAYGDDAGRSIRGLVVRGNRVDHLKLGASESVVVNGNVEHWAIIGNVVESNDNIGIDAIGFEGTLGGKHRYTERNRARDGVIAHNTVRGIASKGNPAYWEDGSWCDCADGIYVDGGTRIRIHHNTVERNDIGIEVAAEDPRGSATHVRVDHNRVTRSLYTGITTGGYCDGADDCGGVRTGSSSHNLFDHNVLRGNNRKDDGSPELLVQFNAHDDRFVHNRITATNREHVVLGTVARAGAGRGDVSDRNVFGAVGGTAATARFGWHGRTFTGFAAHRSATGQDRHSVFR